MESIIFLASSASLAKSTFIPCLSSESAACSTSFDGGSDFIAFASSLSRVTRPSSGYAAARHFLRPSVLPTLASLSAFFTDGDRCFANSSIV